MWYNETQHNIRCNNVGQTLSFPSWVKNSLHSKWKEHFIPTIMKQGHRVNSGAAEQLTLALTMAFETSTQVLFVTWCY